MCITKKIKISETISKFLLPVAAIIISITSLLSQRSMNKYNKIQNLNSEPLSVEYSILNPDNNPNKKCNLIFNYKNENYDVQVPSSKITIKSGIVRKFYSFTYDSINQKYNNFTDDTNQIILRNEYDLSYQIVRKDDCNVLQFDDGIYIYIFLLFEDNSSNYLLDMIFIKYDYETKEFTQGRISPLSLINQEDPDELHRLYRQAYIDLKNLRDTIGDF